MFYQIFDFKAVVKHSYYGCRGAPDSLTDQETGKPVSRWEAAASDFLSRYVENISSFRNVLVAMDGGCDYRRAFLTSYKENRTKREQPKLEREQLDKFEQWAKRFLTYAGATLIQVPGVEADDVIAWLASAEGMKCIIYSVDGDLLQLVGPNCSVNLKGEAYSDEATYHGSPVKFTSLRKSMEGDSSDGYGGVPGFGPKAFQSLLTEIGEDGLEALQTVVDTADLATLEEAAQSRPDSKPLRKLLDNWTTWLDMWRIARLHPELCWKPRAGKLTKPTICKRVPNGEKVLALLKEAGAEDLWPAFRDKFPVMYPLEREDFAARLGTMKDEMKASPFVSFDYETTDVLQIERFREASKKPDFVDVLSQDITGVSFCFGEHLERVVYIPVDHRECDNVPLEELKLFFEWLVDNHIQLVAQNAPFEGVVTRTCLDLALPNVWDTRIMQRYINENDSAHLKDMSASYLSYLQTTYEEVTQGRKMNELTLAEVLKYGCDDSLVTAHLCDLFQLLLSLEHCWNHYLNFAVAPREVLEQAHVEGARVNWALQKRLADADREAVSTGVAELRKLLGSHVSGEVTVGCKSLIEAEREYVQKSLRAKHGEGWKEKYAEWEKKIRSSCTYVPYVQDSVMPKFAFTVKQASAVAVAVGLPEVPAVSKKALGEYLAEIGATKLDAPAFTKDQGDLIDALSKLQALKDGKAWVEENYAERFQKLLWVEPKVIQSGDELNVGSSDQMKQLLYCKLGVPVRLYGKTVGKGRLDLGIRQGAPATDEQAIKAALANDIKEPWQKEALETLLRVKSAQTRIGLFHNTMPLWCHVDGRVHGHITDSGTDTRRPTGGSPNILQIPSHGDGSFMREMWIPPHRDWVTVSIDYSGQELRIIASEAEDPVMIEAYTPGRERDIHSTTATGIAKHRSQSDHTLKPLCDFDYLNRARKEKDDPLFLEADRMRKKAKAVNFLMCYMGGASTLSRNLLVPQEEAEEMLSGVYELYGKVKPWQESTGEFMKKNGYTQTAFGTRRHATEAIFDRDNGVVQRMIRQGVNAVVQSAAAEVLKYTLTGMARREEFKKLRWTLLAPVYDEVVSFVHKDDVLAYWHAMRKLMVDATPPGHVVRQVPELSIGSTWGDEEELGGTPTDEQVVQLAEKCFEKATKVWATDLALTWEDVYGETRKEAA